MPQLEYYERKVLSDEELPIQIFENRMSVPGQMSYAHWHEHIEVHYILQGAARFELGQELVDVHAGDCLIINSNLLHNDVCTKTPYVCNVLIFEMRDISRELADQNHIFTPLIHMDDQIDAYFKQIFKERAEQQPGYKQKIRALITEFVVHLCRNYVQQKLPMRESLKRMKNLERLNAVLFYMENHFQEQISVEELAGIACLSEDRFGHLFRESVGQAPLQYLNSIRLRKAMELLKNGGHTVTAVAEAVGFRDYNHFGRLFRKEYGCTPSQVKGNGEPPNYKNSGIV